MTSVTWTSRVLLAGSLVSAVSFAVGFVLGSIGASDVGRVVSTVGVASMLLTPVVGLVTTVIEAWRNQRQTALAAIGVIAILAVAVGVAVVAR